MPLTISALNESKYIKKILYYDECTKEWVHLEDCYQHYLNNSKMFMRKLNHVSEEYPLLFDGLSLNWSLLETIFCQIKHAVLKL